MSLIESKLLKWINQGQEKGWKVDIAFKDSQIRWFELREFVKKGIY